MKREEKQVIIDNLTEQIKAHKHIYISDISELDAAATQELRRACFKAGIKLIQVKNTLLRVALDGSNRWNVLTMVAEKNGHFKAFYDYADLSENAIEYERGWREKYLAE